MFPLVFPRPARLAAVLSAVLALGFLAGLAWAVLGVLADNPYVLAFGLPTDSAWILVLPWLAALAALVTAAFAVAAWRSGWWGAAARVHYTLVALPGLGLFAWTALLEFV